MTTYPLCFREGTVGLHLHVRDEGVTLKDGVLSWRRAGETVSRPLSDLGQVRLSISLTRRFWRTGLCELTFGKGPILSILSADPLGMHTYGRASDYRRFLQDLHAQIAPADRKRIVFFSGRERGEPALAPWAMWTIVALMAGLLWYVLSALGSRGLWILLPAAAVAGLVVATILHANSGGDYDPANLPARLLP